MNNQLFNAGFVRTCFKAVALAAGLLMHFQVHALAVVDAKLEELADQARVTLFFDQDFDGKLGLFRIANPARQVLDFPVHPFSVVHILPRGVPQRKFLNHFAWFLGIFLVHYDGISVTCC